MFLRLTIIFVFYTFAFFDDVFGYAQHPGAYSSPQYTKKASYYNQKYDKPENYNTKEYQKVSLSETYTNINDRSKLQDIDIPEYSNHQIEPKLKAVESSSANVEDVPQRYNADTNDLVSYTANETQTGRSAGFMESAGNFLNGRGGQMLADIARDLLSRSAGTSSQVGGECWTQVLSLNLTNLVILVILKALILAAGMFGAGAWTHGYGRSLEGASNSQWISGPELELWANYLQGRPECLCKAVCKNPDLAKKYCGGADLMLTVAKMTGGTIPYDIRYEKVLEEVKEAAMWGNKGIKCEEKYKCNS